MVNNGALSTRKSKALASILASKNVQEASELSGIPVRSLYRWLAEEEFQQALSNAEGEAIDSAVRRLTALSEQAVHVLSDCLDSAVAPYVRLKAAQSTLDYILKLRELRGLERRLQALEEVISKHG